jgi:hypothetical protein
VPASVQALPRLSRPESRIAGIADDETAASARGQAGIRWEGYVALTLLLGFLGWMAARFSVKVADGDNRLPYVLKLMLVSVATLIVIACAAALHCSRSWKCFRGSRGDDREEESSSVESITPSDDDNRSSTASSEYRF